MKKKNKSIKKKLLTAFLVVLIIPMILVLTFTEASVVFLRNKSEQLLVDQALDSAEVFVDGQGDKINEQLSGIVSKIEQSAEYAQYIYENSDRFTSQHIKTPDELGANITYNQIHWLPFYKSETNDVKISSEADMLSALEPEFKSLFASCPTVVSLYVATNTHVNIGYDKNVSAKIGIGEYNPETAKADWYINPMANGKQFISDTYVDTFNRGLMVTISVPYSVDGKIRGVIGADINIENINRDILDIKANGVSSAMLFSSDGAPISATGLTEKSTAASLLGSNADEVLKSIKTDANGITRSVINGKDAYIIHSTVKTTGWRLAVILSVDEVIAPAQQSNSTILIINILLIAINAIIIVVMLIAVNRLCNGLASPIIGLTKEVQLIGNGNLEYSSCIHTGDEIETLSNSFEKMTVSLKKYIANLTSVTAEKERIGAELDVATHIQKSMLPCIFPAFPDIKTFDIYATMDPAKEVGGDFYDFFMVDESHLAIVMADVSGKGIPAALFMVIGKTLIKDHTQPGTDLSEVFTTVNNMLCESNSEGLFITAFEGVLDLCTGEFNYVNAGHEVPYICKKDEDYKAYKIRPGFVLAGMENMKYKSGSITLEPGDKIFQYTDGVTEATNANNELYGSERLNSILNLNREKSPIDLLPAVKADIDKFVDKAPQFDDITMLCLEYKERMVQDK